MKRTGWYRPDQVPARRGWYGEKAMRPPRLSIDRARQLFALDQEAGRLFWRISTNGRIKVGDEVGSLCNGYMRCRADGENLFVHRIIWLLFYGEWPSQHLDHMNGERIDNRLSNLRVVSPSENKQNVRRARSDNMSSGLLGVTLDRRSGKWVAQIEVNGRNKKIGRFSDAMTAHLAYVEAKRRLHPGGLL